MAVEVVAEVEEANCFFWNRPGEMTTYGLLYLYPCGRRVRRRASPADLVRVHVSSATASHPCTVYICTT